MSAAIERPRERGEDTGNRLPAIALARCREIMAAPEPNRVPSNASMSTAKALQIDEFRVHADHLSGSVCPIG
jgi:hypothetical protein